jgi:hypothetical protein
MAGKRSIIWKFIFEERDELKAALFNTKSLPQIGRRACVCSNNRIWECSPYSKVDKGRVNAPLTENAKCQMHLAFLPCH